MTSATRVTVSAFGVVVGIAGIEHGVGEVFQGNTAPSGVVIASWPNSELFRDLGGEPAMTIVPNLLVAGILTIIVSIAFLAWAVLFIERRHGALVLLLLSIVMLLVGGGFGPPLLGVSLAAAATRINAPLSWWRARMSGRAGWRLDREWAWVLGASLVTWVLLFPGSLILRAILPEDADLSILLAALTFSAIGLFFVTIFISLARDAHDRGAIVSPTQTRR